MANLTYPRNLSESKANFVTFKALGKAKGDMIGSVTLYCPSSLVSAAGASYGTFDMGMFGDMGDLAGKNADQLASKLKGKTAALEQSPELKALLAGQMLKSSGVPGVDKIGDVYKKENGIAINPNTVTTFQNMTMRANTFQFKLVADSQADSVLIKNIHEFFRKHIYAASQPGNNTILSYPPKWEIKFHKHDGQVNKFIPQIYESFLVGCNSTFNASTNLTFSDGAPIEVDLTLSFQETKVLSQGDIQLLMQY
jgi:hypothetical protein